MLDNGLDMADVGIFSTIALIPFIIKILFGILSDRYNLLGLGHRKPYIFIGLLVQFACLIAVANINPGKSYWLYVAIAFLLQLGMAFYDTCTDGLALDITPESEKGTLQGFMVGGRSVGVIVAASVAGVIAQHLSWPAVFYFLAALTLIPIPFLFFIRELQRTPEMRFNWKAFNAFKNIKVLAVAAVGLIVFLVIVGATQIVNPSFDARLYIDLSTAGLITTSAAVSSFSSAPSAMMLMCWSRMLNMPGAAPAFGRAEMSTAMTMSAPRSRAVETGTGATSPPST
jgi:PAT family beta-lactamase induction signal transducer AmpG